MRINIVEHKTKKYIDSPSELGQRLINAVSQLSYLESCIAGTAEAFLIENRGAKGTVAFTIADKEVLDAKYFSSDVKDFNFGVIIIPSNTEYFILANKTNGTREELIELVNSIETCFDDRMISYDIPSNVPDDIMLDTLMSMGYEPQDIGYIYNCIEDDIKNEKVTREEAKDIKKSLSFDFSNESWDTIFDYEENKYTIKWGDIKDAPNALSIIQPHLQKLGKDF